MGRSFRTLLIDGSLILHIVWARFPKSHSPECMLADMISNDFESELSLHWTALLRPNSEGYVYFRCLKNAGFDDISRAFQSLITHETYRDILSAYLLTEKDQAFTHEYQVKTVQRAGITVTETIETGHSPFLSRAQEVKEFISSFVLGWTLG